MLVEVKALIEKRNRAGLSFTREPKLVEVTAEQKNLIEQDGYLVLRDVEEKSVVVEKKPRAKTPRKQTK